MAVTTPAATAHFSDIEMRGDLPAKIVVQRLILVGCGVGCAVFSDSLAAAHFALRYNFERSFYLIDPVPSETPAMNYPLENK